MSNPLSVPEFIALAPKTLKIGPFEARVVFRTPVVCENQNVNGLWDTNNLLLVVESTLSSKTLTTHIFLHELFHALYWFFEIDKTPKEEPTVACFATGLTMVLQANPELLTWVQLGLSESKK